mmetsp:Transcript_144937/g.270126  ORF Transcript_144937/g.270126 Transcript_144937/m.270126 type:complete len:482 (-) Transcript_144937:184-1629(-)
MAVEFNSHLDLALGSVPDHFSAMHLGVFLAVLTTALMLIVESMHLGIVLVTLSTGLVLFVLRNRRKPTAALATKKLAEDSVREVAANPLDLDEDPGNGLPTVPHLQGCMQPFNGNLVHSNPEDEMGSYFENEFCTGRMLALHRPTYDRSVDRSGNYPYAHVFNGRKINWEIRVQFKFKKEPTGPIQFGIELDQYVPLMNFTKRAMGMTVKAFRWVVGGDLYHSVGDDPETTEGELERPIFSMPLRAVDQVIETPEGEEPPCLGDPNFSQLGYKRAASGRAFHKFMSELKCRTGPTYTINFCSISQFMDNINWELRGIVPGLSVDFNQFCGSPPVHLVIYSNNPQNGDERHLASRRSSYFHLSFWSSKKKPARERLEQLMCTNVSKSGDDSFRRTISPRARRTPSASRKSGREGFLGCMAGLTAPICRERRSTQPLALQAPKAPEENLQVQNPTLLTEQMGKQSSDKKGARALLQEMVLKQA